MIRTILTVVTCHSNFVHKDAHFMRHTVRSHLEPGELAIFPQVFRVILAVVHRGPLHLPLLRDPRGSRGSGSERGLHISGALVRPPGGRRLSEVVWSEVGRGEIGLSLERPA